MVGIAGRQASALLNLQRQPPGQQPANGFGSCGNATLSRVAFPQDQYFSQEGPRRP